MGNSKSEHEGGTRVVFNFDRVTIWVDHEELPVLWRSLECDGATVNVHPHPMRYNPRWKQRVEILQPSIRCLRRIQGALGAQVSALVSYVEIAVDVKLAERSAARRLRDAFLGSAKVRSQRATVKRFRRTWYFGNRAKNGAGKTPNVVAVYADKPSKLHDARGPSDHAGCFHLEWRASGQRNLAGKGIGALADLIDFDHKVFWETHIRLFRLPKKKFLGQRLRELTASRDEVSDSALRKRANNWIGGYLVPVDKAGTRAVFAMHNALVETPQLERSLERVPFEVWLNEEKRRYETP